MIKKVTISEWLKLAKKYKYFVISDRRLGLVGFTNSKAEKRYWIFRRDYEKNY